MSDETHADAPESVADAEDAPEAPAGDEEELNEVLELNAAAIVPMFHPDGGTCDLYPTETRADGEGHITVLLVPANDAASMIEHGFQPLA